jgi:hypothetical protein
MMAYQVAPYPNISCVFEDGIGGPPSVPLDTIAEVKPNITNHNNGTFSYEVEPIIPVSYSTCWSCTSSNIVLYHQIKYLQSCLNTLCMILLHKNNPRENIHKAPE